MSEETPLPRITVCANCGREESRPGVRLCPNCGATLPLSPPTLDAAPAEGGQAQAQLVRPQPPIVAPPPRQPWAVTPDASPDNPQQKRRIAEGGKRGGCTTAILWLLGGLFVFGLLIILGLLALCGVFAI
jgi:hypothetical protein